MKKYLFCFLLFFSHLVYAKDNVELIVASSPGGSVHRYALHIQPTLETALGKNVIIAFKPGGNGLIAAKELHNSPKDKLSLMIGNLNSPEVWRENFKNQKIIDVRNDITPVVFLGTIPSVIYSKPNENFKDFRQALNYGKSEKLTIALAANTPNIKLIEGLLNKHNHEENLTIVPFKTGSQGLFGVLGGHVTLGVTVIDILIPEFEKSSIVPLALVYESRLKSLPNLPTLKEMKLSIENEDLYYNNMFLWTNADKNSEEVNKLKTSLHEFLNGNQSEKFISSMFIQFGQNNIRTPEKYLNKILK